jgi:hypothetical protein
MAYFLPFRSFQSLRVFRPKNHRPVFPQTDCASLALRRHLSVSPKLAAVQLKFHVDGGFNHSAPRLSFTALQRFRTPAPLFSLPFRKASEDRCPDPQKSRPQGLATLSAVSAIRALGSVFQPPTLMGFALQSFPLAPWSTDSFESVFPLLRFPAKPVTALHRRFSGLLPQRKPHPLYCSPKG